MSSAQRSLRATEARRARRARETIENGIENLFGARSASSTPRTAGTQGDVLLRPRQRQSATRRVTTTGPVISVSPVVSSGSPSQPRRHETQMRTTQRTGDEVNLPAGPRTTGDDIASPHTPRSYVSREEGEARQAPSEDDDGSATEDPVDVTTDEDEVLEENQNDSEVSGVDRPSAAQDISFDTTSEGEPEERTRESVTGDKRPRLSQREASRKKARKNSPDISRSSRSQKGQEVGNLRQTILDMEMAYGAISAVQSQQHSAEPSMETLLRSVHPPPPVLAPSSPASWGTIRSHGDSRSIDHRGNSHSLPTMEVDNRRERTRADHHHEGRHDDGGHHHPPTWMRPPDLRRVGHDHPAETHVERVERRRVATHSVSGRTDPVGKEVTTDEGMTSFEDRSPRRGSKRITREPLGVVTVDSVMMVSDNEEQRGRHKPLAKLEDLSKGQLIQELRMWRRQASTPTVDHMDLFARRAREAKSTFQEIAEIARGADSQTPYTQQSQVPLKKTVHAISTRKNDWSEDVDGGTLPAERTLSIQAITETVRKQLAQEMASIQHLEDTVRQLKWDLSNFQVLQDTRSDNHGPPINRGGERPTRSQPSGDRVRLPHGVCSKCGSKDHLKCAWREPCEHCGRPGHKSEVCFTRLREQQSRTGTK